MSPPCFLLCCLLCWRWCLGLVGAAGSRLAPALRTQLCDLQQGVRLQKPVPKTGLGLDWSLGWGGVVAFTCSTAFLLAQAVGFCLEMPWEVGQGLPLPAGAFSWLLTSLSPTARRGLQDGQGFEKSQLLMLLDMPLSLCCHFASPVRGALSSPLGTQMLSVSKKE